jgi:hypothetical protein
MTRPNLTIEASEYGGVTPRRERVRTPGPSAQLILEGVVASYIHDISERHTAASGVGRRLAPADGEELA